MMKKNFFLTAKPVWPNISHTEMNYVVGFHALINTKELAPTYLNIAAATLYRICVNGEFVGYGPARAAKNHFRVDSINLTDKLSAECNIVTIEVVVYNTQTSYIMEQEPFLLAEIVSNNCVLASTNGEGSLFNAHRLTERVQQTPRYSLQRGFVEYYRLAESNNSWKTNSNCTIEMLPLNVLKDKLLLDRSLDYPDYQLLTPTTLLKKAEILVDKEKDSSWRPMFTRMVGKITKGFEDPDVVVNPVELLNKTVPIKTIELNEPFNRHSPYEIQSNTSLLLEFKKNFSGFIGATVEVEEDTNLYFVFDEALIDGDVDLKRAQVNTVIGYDLKKGQYKIESLEVYTFKFLKLINFTGKCLIHELYLREYTNPDTHAAAFECSQKEINELFQAGIETYRQNSVDLFTDCPSRERGGYLCDSYFTAKAANMISGNTKVEDNFLENYLLAESFDRLPNGMIPMCYPADIKVNYRDFSSPYGMYIPNWSLWFIIQLKEYAKRNPSSPLIPRLKAKVLGIIGFFEAYLNEDGLLENLPGWVFIEWSKANDYVEGVNYPSNMLYAASLEIVGTMYKMDSYLEQSNRIKETIRRQSFDGEFFIDNAIRVEGSLEATKNKTEVCQYYAFFFGIATESTYEKLWSTLIHDFGPIRKKTASYPEVGYANAFIGNFLRLDLLSNAGLINQWLQESTQYFGHMVDLTGTLWEHDDIAASCNHGFGSYVVYWIYKNILGVEQIDRESKKVVLCFHEHGITQYKGRLPVLKDFIEIEVEKKDQLHCKVKLPEGFELETVNNTSLDIFFG
ncbi:MAG: hypothetical protein K0S04_3103 [Herbinix sp.]|jgi:alpha-L-rhamnosidase|nr:hypothetical protein [Herbinix sp.]